MTKHAAAKNWGLPAVNGRRYSAGAPESIFPLAVHPSGRYLVDAQGNPFLIHGDTPWSLVAQLTDEEITAYIEDRAEKGFTAIMFNAIEHRFTSQSPAYLNVDDEAPFTSMTDFASSLNEAYWSRVDHAVNTAQSHGIVCVINPAYFGYNGGAEGWASELSGESDADLQTYGQRLAQRYTQGNVIWCMGGDYSGTSGLRAKQWNIVTGIRSVRTTDIITTHPTPREDAYTAWSGFSSSGFSLNFAYPELEDVYTHCLNAYARNMPFIMGEAIYENERGLGTAALCRMQAYQALCSGACGHFFGNNPIWHFESPNAPYSFSQTWEQALDSDGSQHIGHVGALFKSLEWWKLAPAVSGQLVTSSLGNGNARICPALASDGSLAVIWVPSSTTVTVNMSAMSPSSVRARLYNPTTGQFTTVAGSPFTNSGTQNIATGGERVIVLDAA